MTTTKTLGFLTVAAAGMLLAAAGGCADAPGISYSPAPKADDPAEEAFARGADRPATPKTLFALSRVLAAQGKDAQCEALLVRVVRMAPAFLPAYCDLAEVRLRTGRTEAAAAALDAGLKRSPDDPVLLNNLGMCRMLQERYDDALAYFTRAASAMPEKAKYRANMAAALGMLGRDEEAAALYGQAVGPEDARHNVAVLRAARRQPPTQEAPTTP